MNKLRELLERYRFIVIPLVLLIAAVALWWALRAPKLPPRVIRDQMFFIDLETGEVSVHNMAEVPPLTGKAGKPSVVKAHFYSCDGGKTRKIAFIETYTPDGKAALKEMLMVRDRPPPDALQQRVIVGTLVARPPRENEKFPFTPEWVTGEKPEALMIANSFECPPDGKMMLILPPKGEAVVLK